MLKEEAMKKFMATEDDIIRVFGTVPDFKRYMKETYSDRLKQMADVYIRHNHPIIRATVNLFSIAEGPEPEQIFTIDVSDFMGSTEQKELIPGLLTVLIHTKYAVERKPGEKIFWTALFSEGNMGYAVKPKDSTEPIEVQRPSKMKNKLDVLMIDVDCAVGGAMTIWEVRGAGHAGRMLVPATTGGDLPKAILSTLDFDNQMSAGGLMSGFFRKVAGTYNPDPFPHPIKYSDQ